MERLKLSDIALGADDAKIEVENASSEKNNFFREYYFESVVSQIDRFYLGQKYIVRGFKGAGKTALLRYLSIEYKEMYGDVVEFILFKSKIRESDRKNMSVTAGMQFAETEGVSVFEQNFEDIWVWFIHTKIYSIIKNDKLLFLNDESFKKYFDFMESFSDPNVGGASSISNLILKDGTVKLKANFSVFSVEWAQNYGFDPKSGKMPIDKIADLATSLLKKCKIADRKIFLFFDELEVHYASEEMYRRDCRLIRDLILSISFLNEEFKEANISIRLMCALRDEVLSSVVLFGGEVNKIVADRGVRVRWDSPVRHQDQPIVKMIEKRFMVSEKHYLGCVKNNDIWTTYFPAKIEGQKPINYILDMCNFRPRDVVRLLSLIAEIHPNIDNIEDNHFRQIKKEFSNLTWDEMTQDLLVSYSPNEVEFIKSVLLNLPRKLEAKNLAERFEGRAISSPEGSSIIKKKKSWMGVLEDLYRSGILGNEYFVKKEKKNRWMFRGDDVLDKTLPVAIHRSLRSSLSIV
ncbi:P-loop ATPase, Sll1717 family [Thalassobaculum sp.]|uniref:P-loop ATPase, Sll1717 family n=1 Tax=Thalassobaculum sp. TaxID=2022740 RepID=UPI003B5ADDAA